MILRNTLTATLPYLNHNSPSTLYDFCYFLLINLTNNCALHTICATCICVPKTILRPLGLQQTHSKHDLILS